MKSPEEETKVFRRWGVDDAGAVLNGVPNEKHLTGYFVLFIVSALFNGFNVRDDGFGIFKGLNENTGFLKVFFAIIVIQALIVNAALVPFTAFTWIGNMFSCEPFGLTGWIAVILLAFTMIPVDMIRKLFSNRQHAS